MVPCFRPLLLAASLMLGGGAAFADAGATVSIKEYKFHPDTLTVKVGTTVRWVNDEKRTSHSVLFLGEKMESERFFPGESYSRKFDAPGSYQYGCGPHPEMRGEIKVEP